MVSSECSCQYMQVKLLQRYLTLVELYGKTHNHDAVMTTLCKTWQSLPSKQLQIPVTIQLLTEQWVWLKRSVSRGCEDVNILGKRLLPLLDKPGVSLETQVCYLEEELSLYQGLSQPYSHTAIVTVLCDLITLHTHQDTSLVAAHYRIQLACVCRHCTLLCQHTQTLPPTGLLAEALAILSDHTPSSLVHQGLATAHLWRAIVTAEQNMRYVCVTHVDNMWITCMSAIVAFARSCLQKESVVIFLWPQAISLWSV